jgi:hypothetical protein
MLHMLIGRSGQQMGLASDGVVAIQYHVDESNGGMVQASICTTLDMQDFRVYSWGAHA